MRHGENASEGERTIVGKRSAQRENMDKTKKRTSQLLMIQNSWSATAESSQAWAVVRKRGSRLEYDPRSNGCDPRTLGWLVATIGVASKPSYDIDWLD